MARPSAATASTATSRSKTRSEPRSVPLWNSGRSPPGRRRPGPLHPVRMRQETPKSSVSRRRRPAATGVRALLYQTRPRSPYCCTASYWRPARGTMTQATGPAKTGTGKYEALLERCRSLEAVPTAVAHPCEHSALAGGSRGRRAGTDHADPRRPGGQDRGARRASTASTSARPGSSTPRTATRRPRRRWRWSAPARPSC